MRENVRGMPRTAPEVGAASALKKFVVLVYGIAIVERI